MKQLFGEPVVVGTSQVNGQMIYKVVVGNFDSLQQAKSLQSRMKAKGINGFPRKLSDL
jgi:cell division protein FtsN